MTTVKPILEANDFQQLVMRTANSNLGREGALLNSALGLAGESGEYVDLIKKAVYHNHKMDAEKAKLELGDVLFYAAWAARLHGFDLSEVMGAVIHKLRLRYPEGFNTEDSIKRQDVK